MAEKSVLVYALSGQRLDIMPCKAKKMLKGKKAKVVSSNPFGIQLLYESKMYGAFDEYLKKDD